jgi:DNA mismatch endonuclease Vsr
MAKKDREVVRRTMQAIRSQDTKIEILLGKALWAKGYRYRKNDKSVFGKPDFTFKRFKVAVFCDSEFWHGKDWLTLKKRLNTNPGYWHAKIERNINRDIKVNEELRSAGWAVIRFWEKDILKDTEQCVLAVVRACEERAR